MKFWQQKWRSMNGFRRMILVVLALMLVGFGAAMAAAQTRLPFISDGEGRLTPKAEGETLVYSGQLDGGQVRLTVQPDGTAEYQWEILTYGPYQLEGSPEAPVSSALVGPNAREELHQGDWGVFGIGALLTLLVMAWVLLSEAVFQFRASLWARGTGGAEPSQLYTTVERLSWMVVTVLLALLYWMALTRIC